jgi:drug/metabolite transporter (DMT)-like permease
MYAMALSVGLFVGADALFKLAAAELPAIQAIGLLNFFATLWLLIVGARWSFDRMVMARALVGSAGIFVNLIALLHLPLTTVTSIKMTAPLMLAAFGAVALKERAYPIITVVGFAGALLVIQPNLSGLDILWVGLAFLATIINVGRDLLTRYVPETISPCSMALVGSAIAAALGLSWAIINDWKWPLPQSTAILMIASAFLAGAYHFLVIAMRTENIAAGAYVRYTALLWAPALGYAIWGEVPSLPAAIGIALIVATGLVLLRVRQKVPP